ncbi:Transcriptional regulator, IclR family [Desulfatibacillum aliphaticivorans]|uniref:Transcriptional regulator, IclR family n=1 Tax=Desulfatibacillum aliphaticivorans TaxID=218208 RepID=B8FL40_DESAL|nr:IclR family transcriptional regulator [Desulfatibacillum aliphaticivorans]ACL04675.1 Transcriptional regulator, IclR family [Desulfatibacillum aliphaticivorans]
MSVQSVDRALEILSLFSTTSPRLGITDISKAMGLPKPTVHGLVRTLTSHGFLAQDPESKKYSLGLKIHEMGTILAGSLRINQVGGSPAQMLTRSTGLATRLGIWDQQAVLVTLLLFPDTVNVLYHHIGPRIQAYCSSLGKAILAYLPRQEVEDYLGKHPLTPITMTTITNRKDLLKDLESTRARGYALDREECISGMSCIGAPIFNYAGAPVGSISISGPPDQVLGDRTAALARELLLTAQQISSFMGWRPGEAAKAALVTAPRSRVK